MSGYGYSHHIWLEAEPPEKIGSSMGSSNQLLDETNKRGTSNQQKYG
jgi:hypothetical protein